jgi:hypothetical protein
MQASVHRINNVDQTGAAIVLHQLPTSDDYHTTPNTQLLALTQPLPAVWIGSALGAAIV